MSAAAPRPLRSLHSLPVSLARQDVLFRSLGATFSSELQKKYTPTFTVGTIGLPW